MSAIERGVQAPESEEYFPPPDAEGGWRRPQSAAEVRALGVDTSKLDAAFDLMQQETMNGGLCVVKNGWLVYERFFGLGHPEARPNLASCGKSFTSIAMGILLELMPERFPDGLDQKVFTPEYLPAEIFPLKDPRKARIKLGQLLAFSAGIRGNNPGWVHFKEVTLDPVGPDGWQATVDEIALGLEDGVFKGKPFTTSTLWCEPGEGYSYATSSIHLVSIILRRIAGMELERFLQIHLAEPLGWGEWGFAYRRAGVPNLHTSGGGGIALRASDMLRFGYLLLRKGRWGARQVVPAGYVEHCTRSSPYNPHWHYSLQFHVNTRGVWPGVPRDAFWKGGSGGHVIYVVPSLDLVVWKLGGRDGQYRPENTGIPLPDAVKDMPRRTGWTPRISDREGAQRTLELVVSAVK